METGALRYRFLLIGRALCLGILWGAVLGVATWGVLITAAAISAGATDGAVPGALLLSPLAGLVGGVVGGAISLTAGLALALSSSGVLGRVYRARLVTASVAAAVPLAVAGQPRQSLDYSLVAGIATVAAVAAVLMTPRILHGPPARGDRSPRFGRPRRRRPTDGSGLLAHSLHCLH